MKLTFRVLLIFGCALVWMGFVSCAHAATYYVATTGNDNNPGTLAQPFRTIAKSIAVAAADGDTVSLANGTYNEHNLDFGAKNLTLTSQSGNPALCILDCQGLGQGIRINGGQKAATVTGMTIRNGVAAARTSTGGAMTIAHSNATVSNCVFSSCKYTFDGNLGADAICLNSAQSVTITGCTFSGNGGGNWYTRGAVAALNTNSVTLSGCAFTGNSSGGMLLAITPANITDCTFTNNLNIAGGAAIETAGAVITLNRCVFTGNHANNDAANTTGGGGALKIINGDLTLTNCLFTANTSNSGSGGITSQILVEGNVPSVMKLVNCTVIAISSRDFYHNILIRCPRFSDDSDNVTVVNSIVRGASGIDDIFLSRGSRATVTYSNVGTDPDPKFVNPAAGNYRLQSSSPCVNAGSSSATGLPSTDLDRVPRILGSAPDMGAYELWTSNFGDWFVDKALGSDTNSGSPTAPYKTVVKAIASAGNGHKIYIKAGNYGTDKPRITKSLRLVNWGNAGQARVGKP